MLIWREQDRLVNLESARRAAAQPSAAPWRVEAPCILRIRAWCVPPSSVNHIHDRLTAGNLFRQDVFTRRIAAFPGGVQADATHGDLFPVRSVHHNVVSPINEIADLPCDQRHVVHVRIRVNDHDQPGVSQPPPSPESLHKPARMGGLDGQHLAVGAGHRDELVTPRHGRLELVLAGARDLDLGSVIDAGARGGVGALVLGPLAVVLAIGLDLDGRPIGRAGRDGALDLEGLGLLDRRRAGRGLEHGLDLDGEDAAVDRRVGGGSFIDEAVVRRAQRQDREAVVPSRAVVAHGLDQRPRPAAARRLFHPQRCSADRDSAVGLRQHGGRRGGAGGHRLLRGRRGQAGGDGCDVDGKDVARDRGIGAGAFIGEAVVRRARRHDREAGAACRAVVGDHLDQRPRPAGARRRLDPQRCSFDRLSAVGLGQHRADRQTVAVVQRGQSGRRGQGGGQGRDHDADGVARGRRVGTDWVWGVDEAVVAGLRRVDLEDVLAVAAPVSA